MKVLCSQQLRDIVIGFSFHLALHRASLAARKKAPKHSHCATIHAITWRSRLRKKTPQIRCLHKRSRKKSSFVNHLEEFSNKTWTALPTTRLWSQKLSTPHADQAYRMQIHAYADMQARPSASFGAPRRASSGAPRTTRKPHRSSTVATGTSQAEPTPTRRSSPQRWPMQRSPSSGRVTGAAAATTHNARDERRRCGCQRIAK